MKLLSTKRLNADVVQYNIFIKIHGKIFYAGIFNIGELI